MTLHITIGLTAGTEIVCEDDQEPLGFIRSLELGTGVRRAWVSHSALQPEVVDRTADALRRHGFDVGVSS